MTDSKTTKASLASEVARITRENADLSSRLTDAECAAQHHRELHDKSLANGKLLMDALGLGHLQPFPEVRIAAARDLIKDHAEALAEEKAATAKVERQLATERALTDHLLVVLRRGR